MNIKNNHVYIGSIDRLTQWTGLSSDTDDNKELSVENQQKVINKVRELIKNYLQLDSVNFLFGTGSSIHLGAASIQNIPEQAEMDIENSGDYELKDDTLIVTSPFVNSSGEGDWVLILSNKKI